jgi:outer membrane protein insertion porin family
MSGVWICSIILSFSSFAVEIAPKEKKWSVQSESTAVNKIVRSIVKKNKKSEATELEALIQKSLKKDRFLTAKIEIDPINKTINLTSVTKYLILFEGNLALNNRTIKSSIDLDNLISSEATIKDDLSLRIKQTYNKSGYNDVKINAEEKFFKKSNLRRYVFKIDEGLVYSISKITITGSFSKKKKYYTDFIKSKSSKLIKSGKFSKQDLENGLNNLITHLKNKGYLEASYTGLSIEKDSNYNNRVHVSFDLYEGLPTRVQNIRFVGNKNVDSEWLSVLLGFNDNDILDFYKLESGIQQIYDYYLSTGYLEIEINPSKKDFVELNSEKRRADIVVEISESEKVIVGEINVIGLTKTKKYVIENIVDFEVGDVLTIEKITTSRRKLNLIGLFSKVDLNYSQVSTNSDARVITIDVEEKKPGVVQLGFGARFNQRALSLKGYAGFLYKNLGGTARAINSRLELQSRTNRQAYPEHRAFISYYEPFIFDKRVRGRVSLDSSENIFEITSDHVTLFRSIGLDFVLENNFNRNVKASMTLLGIDFNKEFRLQDSTNQYEIREQIGFFGPTLQLDYRNDIFLPTKGHIIRLQSEFGSPLLGTKIIAKGNTDEVKYLRSEGTFTKYTSLHPRLVMVNTVRGGWLKNLSENTTSFPKSRAFFLGGTSTIRGYDPSDGVNERIPSDFDLGINTSARGGDVLSIPGNSYFYLLKTEFRFPVFNNFWGAVFYDGGSVLIDHVPMKDPYRDAAGIGIRYNTPIGALTFYIGFKLDRDKSRGESLERIHINIGTF